jgi:hypothetical protein
MRNKRKKRKKPPFGFGFRLQVRFQGQPEGHVPPGSYGARLPYSLPSCFHQLPENGGAPLNKSAVVLAERM